MDIMTKKIRLIDSVIKIMNDIEDEVICHTVDGDEPAYDRLLKTYQYNTLEIINGILNGVMTSDPITKEDL